MFAMQYRIMLPKSFDMTAVRSRIVEKGPSFDDLPGLRQKAFLINEASRNGTGSSVGNEYATFYVWESLAAARDFLLGDRFAAVVDSFGRPQVRGWLVVASAFKDAAVVPGFALAEFLPVPGQAELGGVEDAERAERDRIENQPGLHSWISAIDTDRWEGVRFSLWENAAAAEIPNSGSLVSWDVARLAGPTTAEPHMPLVYADSSGSVETLSPPAGA